MESNFRVFKPNFRLISLQFQSPKYRGWSTNSVGDYCLFGVLVLILGIRLVAFRVGCIRWKPRRAYGVDPTSTRQFVSKAGRVPEFDFWGPKKDLLGHGYMLIQPYIYIYVSYLYIDHIYIILFLSLFFSVYIYIYI